MNLSLFHAGAALIAGGGNPLYEVHPEHLAALAGVALLPIAAWVVRGLAPGSARARALVSGYDALPVADRIVAWLLAVSAVVHAALVTGHGGPVGLAFLAAAALLGVATYRFLVGRSWRRLAVLTLLGSIAAWCVATVSGEPPDEAGIATKIAELAALAFIWRPGMARARRFDRMRRVVGTARVPLIAVLLSVVAWTGAFAAGKGEADLGHAAVPGPGTVMPAVDHLVPTTGEIAAADDLYARVSAGIARYADPAVAAADGYRVEGMFGRDFHAENPAYGADGRILDPERPETLVYAMSSDGRPVLLGAMFSMPDRSEPGPAVGGPLTVWHAHDHLCIGLTPPGLTGIRSPLGACPMGAIEIPITPQMIHVWTVPGAPARFGDLDGAWLEGYLARG